MSIRDKKMIFADLSLLIVALLWGGGFVAVKDAIDVVPPFYMITIRFAVSSLILSIIFWKRFKNINKKDVQVGFLTGIFLFLAFAAQTMGAQFTTAGKQAFLTGVNVVIVPIFNRILYKKKIDFYSILASILCLVGIGFLTLKHGTIADINIGDILTLICAVFFAVHITLLGHFAKEGDTVILAIMQMATASVIAFICALIFEHYPRIISGNTYFSMIYIIVFSTMLAFLIQTLAQKYTTSTHASIILCLESVFGSILAVVFLRDVFTLNMIIGCILIFIGVVTAETKFKFLKKNKERVEIET